MDKYIMKQVLVEGTEVNYFTTIRDFFINNTVMPFTLEEEKIDNVDGESNYLKLKNDDYLLYFTSTATDNSSSSYYVINITLYKNNEKKELINTWNISSFVEDEHAYWTRDDIKRRGISVFIIKNEDLELICIQHGSVVRIGRGTGLGFFKFSSPELKTLCGVSTWIKETTSSAWTIKDYSSLALYFTLYPFHSYATTSGDLIVDNEIAIVDENKNYYLGSSSAVFGLGGGAAGTFYKEDTGSILYCLDTNVGLRLGERVEN